MNIEFTYEKWFNRYKDQFDQSVTYRGLNGLQERLYPSGMLTFYYPVSLIEEIGLLPIDGAVFFSLYSTTYLLEDGEYNDKMDLKFVINNRIIQLLVEIDHLEQTIFYYTFVPEEQSPFSTISEYVEFKQAVYQKVEAFIREISPNRLCLVTNSYKRKGDLSVQAKGCSE